MKIKFSKCNYKVNLYKKNDDGSLGLLYVTETFSTQEEVEAYLDKRSQSEVFHFSVSVQLIGEYSSW